MEALVIFLWLPISFFLHGLIFKSLWEWFLIPLGVGPIGIAQSIGIMLMFSMVFRNRQKVEEEVEHLVLKDLVESGLIFLIAWIVHAMM